MLIKHKRLRSDCTICTFYITLLYTSKLYDFLKIKVTFVKEREFREKEKKCLFLDVDVDLKGCLTWTDQVGSFDASLA